MNRRGLLGFFAMALAPGVPRLTWAKPTDDVVVESVKWELLNDPCSLGKVLRALMHINGAGFYVASVVPADFDTSPTLQEIVRQDLLTHAKHMYRQMRAIGSTRVRIEL